MNCTYKKKTFLIVTTYCISSEKIPNHKTFFKMHISAFLLPVSESDRIMKIDIINVSNPSKAIKCVPC